MPVEITAFLRGGGCEMYCLCRITWDRCSMGEDPDWSTGLSLTRTDRCDNSWWERLRWSTAWLAAISSWGCRKSWETQSMCTTWWILIPRKCAMDSWLDWKPSVEQWGCFPGKGSTAMDATGTQHHHKLPSGCHRLLSRHAADAQPHWLHALQHRAVNLGTGQMSGPQGHLAAWYAGTWDHACICGLSTFHIDQWMADKCVAAYHPWSQTHCILGLFFAKLQLHRYQCQASLGRVDWCDGSGDGAHQQSCCWRWHYIHWENAQNVARGLTNSQDNSVCAT